MSPSTSPVSADSWDSRTRFWTSVVLGGCILWNVPLLHYFISRKDSLPSSWRLWIQAGIVAVLGCSLLVVLVMLLFQECLKRQHLEWAVAGLFVLMAVVPGCAKTFGRLTLGPERMGLDSFLQVELASGMLREGRNPYREDFAGTELDKWHQGGGRYPTYHLVYLPLPILMTLPLREVCLGLFGGYDSRFLLLPLGIGAFLWCWVRWRGHPWRAALLAAAFLNPLIVPSFHLGRWDVLVLFLWVFSMAAAASGRPKTMAFGLAMAFLTKVTMLPAALFGAIYACRTRREWTGWLSAFGIPCLLLIGPFLLWDAWSLVEDILISTSGRGPAPLPIEAGAFGLADWVFALGGATYPWDYFPFWIVQIPVTAAIAVAGLVRLRRNPSPAMMAWGTALTIGAILYLGRFSNGAYFGTLLSMVAIGSGFSSRPGEARNS